VSVQDKTWDLTIKVRVTTMAGWQPDRDDVEGWLGGGEDVLELVQIENVQEVKQIG
jgi:hypothetical protein